MANAWITASDLTNSSDPDAPFAAEAASWVLYKLSGQKYPGTLETTEVYRQGSTECDDLCSVFMFVPIDPHVHVNVPNARVPRELRLRGRPISSISSVSVHGSALDPSDYSIRNSAYLVRTAPYGWDLSGSGVSVTYTYGINPPEAGKRAAVVLADELIKLVRGDEECRLPERVTSVSRQGVSYTVMDPNEFIKDGRVGIYEVDLFIHAANPSGATMRPKVFSPDMPRGERVR